MVFYKFSALTRTTAIAKTATRYNLRVWEYVYASYTWARMFWWFQDEVLICSKNNGDDGDEYAFSFSFLFFFCFFLAMF